MRIVRGAFLTTAVLALLGAACDDDDPAGPVDPTGVAGFDIVYLGGSNYAYAVLNVGGTTSLYSVSLSTGAATAVAAVGGGLAIEAIAIQP